MHWLCYFTAVCQTNQSFCVTYKQCLPSTWWCDGKVDCPQGDDEGMYCSYADCDPTEFQCMSGKCIDMTYHCDGQADCEDKSDEVRSKGLETCGIKLNIKHHILTQLTMF